VTRRPTITPREAERLGWIRTDPRPWSKCSARWVHRTGWRLEHCGHPTANWPWALYHPDGRFVGTGMVGPFQRPDFGGGWPSLAEAMDLVARVECGAEVVPDPPYGATA
jgi:hypothetical protein